MDITTESFLKQSKELDKFIKSLDDSNSSSFQEFEKAAKLFWVNPLKELVLNNSEFLKTNISGVQKAFRKSYRSFISPIFLRYITDLTYDDFPYEVEERHFKKLIKGIKSSKSPFDMQKAIDEFSLTFIRQTYAYTFNKLFRPIHPLYYMLKEIEDSSKVIEADAARIVAGINPFLFFPQNKVLKDLQFALAVSSGASIQLLMSIKSAKALSDWEVSYETVDGEKGSLQLIHHSDIWIRALKFLISSGATKAQAQQAFADVPLFMIGFPLSYKSIPAFHSALCAHFRLASEPYSGEFRLTGPSDIEQLIKSYSNACDEMLKAHIANTPEAAVISETVRKDPAFKLTVLSIKQTAKVNQQRAQQVNDIFDVVYAPVERRPTRKEKYG